MVISQEIAPPPGMAGRCACEHMGTYQALMLAQGISTKPKIPEHISHRVPGGKGEATQTTTTPQKHIIGLFEPKDSIVNKVISIDA